MGDSMLVAVNREHSLLLTGTGDVIEPDNGILAIGSGGPYAQAAALALMAKSDCDAEEICRTAMEIAASICIYTNQNLTLEKIVLD
jgi:ATP-dependent HslUV protease subunit HslV